MKLGGQVGHNPGKNPLYSGTGRPDGGALITIFIFWTFEA